MTNTTWITARSRRHIIHFTKTSMTAVDVKIDVKNEGNLQANWYKASQYCRFHGMHLASIESARENGRLESYIQEVGLGHEHFWTSGTDQGEEGRFFWMSNGRPITFDNWNAGEPNNFQYEENGEMDGDTAWSCGTETAKA
ncbi:alpha-N-acetylgalactosamine-specific lectin-like [Penaeus vannamei]|uniref:alpha-N-acetylgalactosamine-specific lectin-like n=1 Tax=Penaeus vannamei TaxID=6689 RepID=UPI00387F389F